MTNNLNNNKHFMKNILKSNLLLGTLLVGLVTGITSCHNNQPNDNSTDTTDDQSDTASKWGGKFLVKATLINLDEIQLGQMAQKNATTEDAKEMGRMMEADHTKAQNELKSLAKQKSITIPTTLDKDGQDDYNKLNSKTGIDFDKEYCDMMVSGHKDAISLFEKDSAKATDPDIRQWAINTLPDLRKHRDHAIMCKEACKKM